MKFIRKIQAFAASIFKKIRFFVKKKALPFIDRKPFVTFLGVLALIVLLIVIGNQLRKPKESADEGKKEPKEVETFSIGKAPRMTFSGKVEKTGVIKLVAQSGGVVQQINKLEGGKVGRGEVLFWLSSNYQGGTIPTVSRQIAEKNVASVEANYPLQKEMIAKRRDIAHKTDGNQDELRAITAASIEDTRRVVSLNEQVVAALQAQVDSTGGSDPTAVSALAGALSGLNALKTQLRTSEYMAGGDQEPQALSDLGKEVTLKQIDLEERGLELSREIAALNLTIARISESLSYPASPGRGVIERVHVSIGQAVNPGTVLATITCDENVANIIVSVSSEIAAQLTTVETSRIIIGSKTIDLAPRYISTEPVEGTLHQVVFTLPAEYADAVGNGSGVAVEMPIGLAKSTAAVPFVPIDAVFQTQASSLIYVATPSAEGTYVVSSQEITLGSVFGSFVQVLSGLTGETHVILSRNVITGDEVTLQ